MTRLGVPILRFALAALAVAALSGLLFPLRAAIDTAALALLYLVPVGLVTAGLGQGPGIAAAVLSFLAFNYLFVPPYYSLRVLHADNVDGGGVRGRAQNRLDLSVGIALGSSSQFALFVAPVLVLLSYVIGPAPMDLLFWPGAVVMVLIATLTATLATNSGRSAWFLGALVLAVYLIFATALYLLPPRGA